MLFPPSWYGPHPDYYRDEPDECPRCGVPAEPMIDGLCGACDDELEEAS